MQNGTYSKLLNLELFRNLLGLYLYSKIYRSFEVIKKNQSI